MINQERIEDLKAAQNLHFQACLNLIRENQRRHNEDIENLVKEFSDDLAEYTKSMREILVWYESQKEVVFNQALTELMDKKPSSKGSNNQTKKFSSTLIEVVQNV